MPSVIIVDSRGDTFRAADSGKNGKWLPLAIIIPFMAAHRHPGVETGNSVSHEGSAHAWLISHHPGRCLVSVDWGPSKAE